MFKKGQHICCSFFLSLFKSKFRIMKIKCKVDIVREGVEYEKDDILDIPESNVDKWIAKGWGTPIEKKEQKVKKQTKELKIDKETK